MNPLVEQQLLLSRRQFFGASGLRMGGVALAMMAGRTLAAEQVAPPQRMHPALPDLPHFAPKAKAIIYLHMNGGPAQLDTLDYKPKLQEYFDKDLPDSIRNGQRITTMTSGQTRFPCAPSVFKFNQYGKHGAWISELMPNVGSIADDITIVKSVNTDAINHDPAITFIQTGSQIPGRPSMGAWMSYGIG